MIFQKDLDERFPALRRLALRWRSYPIPYIPQLSSSDCGPACLTMVLGYFGKSVPLAEIRSALGTARDGTNAASLISVARRYHLRGRAVSVEMGALRQLPRGAILFWEFRHYVVLERIKQKAIHVVDPAFGRRRIPIEKFGHSFTGVALIFERMDSFVSTKFRPERCVSSLLRKLISTRARSLARIISISVFVQLLGLAIPFLTALVVDKVVPKRDYHLLLVATAGLGAFQLGTVACSFLRSHLLLYLRTQLDAEFTLGFVEYLVQLPYSFFQQRPAGDLLQRLGSNSALREILTSTALSAILDGAVVTLYLPLLFLISFPLSLFVVGTAIARIVLLLVVRVKQKRLLSESLEVQAKSQSFQVEFLSAMETLKAMGLEHRAVERWSDLYVDTLNIGVSTGRLSAAAGAISGILETSATVGLLSIGTFLVLRGAFTLGTMLAFTAIAGAFLSPLSNLISSALQLHLAESHLERVDDVLSTPQEQMDANVAYAGQVKGALQVEEVSFRYSANAPWVLRNVSLSLEPGTNVAIVGRTGSGKSTLARLLAGLYEPTTGRVLFGGKDLTSLDRHSLRMQLGVVTQEIQLFSGTIRQNIALANPEMPLSKIIDAAILACLDDEISAMPMGYETVLADRGLSLSGGQRQRLAIARAIANGPRILILDEATSHLDEVTERVVISNLASLKCTRVSIAHRLSTVQEADLILVMDKGVIVDSGEHSGLLKSKSLYARLIGAPCFES